MNKKIAGVAVCFIGLAVICGSMRFLPDLKPLGFGLALFAAGAIAVAVGFLNRSWNWRMWLGLILSAAGIVGVFATVSYLPDWRPLITMTAAGLLGILFLWLGIKKAEVIQSVGGSSTFNILAMSVVIILFIISALLLPQINWQHPKDPAAVMILAFFTGLAVLYAKIKNHPAKYPIVYAGLLAVVNFIMIPVYEAGFFDWLGRFYRLFVPFYFSFDSLAEPIEYGLIGLAIILTAYFAFKKTRIRDYGNKILIYFMLQIFMAIFFFEMLGLPAGFLAGATTRSDLLVTDTNAVMSTFGMIFIAVAMFVAFELFPFWVTPILAGLWWVFWKPWLLHHPDPVTFTGLANFLPAAAFLFFTGFKRVALPMVLLLLFFKKNKGN